MGGVELTADQGLRYRILARLGLVELSGARAPDLSDVLEVFDAVLADSAFRTGCGFLYDRRQLGSIAPDFIRSMVNQLGRRERLAGCRLALVVDEAEQAHMFHLTTVLGGEPLMLRTFQDPDEARLWLAMRSTQ